MLKEKVARAIRQLKKGKTEYFDEIYDLTRASVYYVIRGVLKDNYLVEDAMQETYVAFLNSVAKIDDEQNPLSYLLQIAKNKALDEARRKTRAAGANIDEAATYLIEKMDEAGLVKDKGKVRISVADKKTGKRIDEKQRHAVDVVNNLFKNKNKDVSAMILSDNDIDAIEDYYDNNNVGEYEKQMVEEFKAKLLLAIDKKIGRIDELLNILKPWEKDERKVKHLDQNDAEKAALEAIKVYCADYKVNYYEVANDEIAEFYEDLVEKKKDLLECIDDINNPDGDDSYGEILSDLLEIVKEELFEQED